MANFIDDFTATLAKRASGAVSSAAANPVRTVQNTLSGLGTKTALLKATKGFGGSVAGMATLVNEPRKSYNFQISMGINGHAIEANVKAITRPKITFEYRQTRYLNTVKRVLKAVHFEPITITVYDDLAGKVQAELKNLVSGNYSGSLTEVVDTGKSINLKGFNESLIDEIVIHSSSSPVSSLISVGLDTIHGLDLEKALAGSSVENMILKGCTIEAIDFGEFDYTVSNANEITISVSFQALAFGSTSVSDAAINIIGGIGGRLITGAY